MGHRLRSATVVALVLAALGTAALVAPANAHALSEGCDGANGSPFDSEYGRGGTVGVAWGAGETITASAGQPSSGTPTTVSLTVAGTTVDTAAFPGTVEYTFPSDGAPDVFWAVDGETATWTVTCTPPPDLTINDVSMNEGNSGTTSFTFTVGLSAPARPGGVTFDIATADRTAQDDNPVSEDNDYVAQSLTGQTIPEGSSTYSFTVSVNGDTTVEPNETFAVNVSNVSGATVSDGQGQGTILNDDAAPPAAPTCNGQAATVYVNAQGVVVGGPRNGRPYRGNLPGTAADDVIVGTSGPDEISARGGNDVVCAGGGNDEIEAGAGNDTMSGGPGADQFKGGAGTDAATDFSSAEGDTKRGVEIS
jgi:Ca2+-binding RTX toxin-like protein